MKTVRSRGTSRRGLRLGWILCGRTIGDQPSASGMRRLHCLNSRITVSACNSRRVLFESAMVLRWEGGRGGDVESEQTGAMQQASIE